MKISQKKICKCYYCSCQISLIEQFSLTYNFSHTDKIYLLKKFKKSQDYSKCYKNTFTNRWTFSNKMLLLKAMFYNIIFKKSKIKLNSSVIKISQKKICNCYYCNCQM